MKNIHFQFLPVFVFLLPILCFGQKGTNSFPKYWQISAKATIGWMRPDVRFAEESSPAILKNDRPGNIFILPELEVHTPIGFIASIGYLNAAVKPNASAVIDQLKEENIGLTVTESDNNYNSNISCITPGIGWRFQFVEKAFFQPYVHWITGQYANAGTSYVLSNTETNSSQSLRFEKGTHNLRGFGLGFNILTEHNDLTGDGTGFWYGLHLGWSTMNATGDLVTERTDDSGTAAFATHAFDKTWNSIELGVSIGLLIRVSKKKEE